MRSSFFLLHSSGFCIEFEDTISDTAVSHRGLRACPGQQIALAVVAYVLTRILQEFKDIQSRDERPWKEGLGLTMYNANGVHVAFTPA